MRIWNNSLKIQVRSLCAAAVLAVSAVSATPALAGGGGKCHFHGSKPAEEATVIGCAEMHKSRLVKKGTIDASWETIKHESIQQVDAKDGKKEWKVMFKDPAAKDKAKETLYMFFSLSGNFVASNFSGK